jgi:pyrimidine operon attenuation protein/uracil phosphoribosyltransferase
MPPEEKILAKSDIEKIIADLSRRIINDITDLDSVAIVGVHTRGVYIAERIKKKIEELSGKTVKSGTLDISFYRDDIATRGKLPVLKETLIDFNINGKTVLLVDDVLFTGRTTKAAIETLMAFGRPHAIRFLVLVDRGHRELPIQADYCGIKVDTDVKDTVKVRLYEADREDDSVYLIREQQ